MSAIVVAGRVQQAAWLACLSCLVCHSHGVVQHGWTEVEMVSRMQSRCCNNVCDEVRHWAAHARQGDWGAVSRRQICTSKRMVVVRPMRLVVRLRLLAGGAVGKLPAQRAGTAV